MKAIGIVLGSRTDLPVAQKAIDTLKEFEVPFEVHILSAHRLPGETAEYARAARGRGLAAVIACAGMADTGISRGMKNPSEITSPAARSRVAATTLTFSSVLAVLVEMILLTAKTAASPSRTARIRGMEFFIFYAGSFLLLCHRDVTL